jgi:WD40 repeat protein
MPFALTVYSDPFCNDHSYFNTLNGNLYLETFDPNFENSNSDLLCSSTDPYKYFYFNKTQPEAINFLTGYRQILNVIYEKNESSIYFSPSVSYFLEPPLTMSNDGSMYMSGGNTRLYTSTHNPKIAFSADTGGEVYFTDFSENDRQIVLCSKNGWYLWDSRTAEELYHQNGHENGVRWGAFSDNGQLLLTAGGEGKIIEWNLSSGEPHEIVQITGPISFIRYIHTDTQILAVNETGSVFIIDRSYQNIIQQNQVPYLVQSKDDVDVTQDERYVLIENQILDLQTNTWLPAFGNYEMGNTNIIQVRISPDEKWIGVREAPGIVRVWDWAHVFGGISNINHFTEY